MYAAVQLEQFEIDTKQEKLLFVELFTIDTKVSLDYYLFEYFSNLVFELFVFSSWSTKC